jgi:hypothetical protein
MESATTTTATGRRNQHLDLLRAAVVGGLLLFHTAYVLDPPSPSVMWFSFFAKLWAMPLLFSIAGAGIWYSLGARDVRGFFRERLLRLLVPLVTGVVLIVPPQVFYSLRAAGQDPGSYWSFLDRFFDVRLTVGFPVFLRGAVPGQLFELGHLWFLYYLLTFSLLLLPLLLYLRRSAGRGPMEWVMARCHGARGFVAFALPIALVEGSLGTWDLGGWNSYAYLLFLLYGYLVAADRRLNEALMRNWKQALVIGMMALPVLFLIAHYDLGGAGRLLGADYHPWSVVWRLLRAVAGLAWICALFGLAASLVRFLPGRGEPSLAVVGIGTETARPSGDTFAYRVTRYAGEAVLPFYILHNLPVVVIGYHVAHWSIAALLKYLTICLASLVATLVLYDICVRRTDVTRVLFGMRRRVVGS